MTPPGKWTVGEECILHLVRRVRKVPANQDTRTKVEEAPVLSEDTTIMHRVGTQPADTPRQSQKEAQKKKPITVEQDNEKHMEDKAKMKQLLNIVKLVRGKNQVQETKQEKEATL